MTNPDAAEIAAHHFTGLPKAPGIIDKLLATATPKTWMPEFGVYGCTCVAKWLPLYQMSSLIHGDISNGLDVYQGCYHPGVGASAGSHDKGACYDLGQLSDRQIQRARERGGCHQHRTTAQGFIPHMHGWPNGCTHGSPLQQYQQQEWNAGRNGLVSRAAITGPGPIGKDTPHWEEGVRLMQEEIMAFADDVAKKAAARTVATLLPAINAVPGRTVNSVGINISTDPRKPNNWSLGHILSWVPRSVANKDQITTLQSQITTLQAQVTALKTLVNGLVQK